MKILLSLSQQNEFVYGNSNELLSLSDKVSEKAKQENQKRKADARMREEAEELEKEEAKKKDEDEERERWTKAGKKSLKEYGEMDIDTDELSENLSDPFDGGRSKHDSKVSLTKNKAAQSLRSSVRTTPTSHTPTYAHDR